MLRAVIIASATLFGMLAGLVSTFALVALTETCPTGVRTCDIGPIAGAALGFLVSPFSGLLCGWLATRYTRRRNAKSHVAAI